MTKWRSLSFFLVSTSIIFTTTLDSKRSFEEKPLQINAGPLFNYAQYNLGDLSKIEGHLAGIHIDIQHGTPSRWYGYADFDGRWNPSFVCGEQDLKSTVHDYRTQGFFGYSFHKTASCSFTPFAGLGFYHLSDKLKPNIMTYRYSTLYIPIGFKGEWIVHPECLQISLTALYRAGVASWAKVSTPGQPSSYEDARYAHGVHIEIPFLWYHAWGKKIDLQTKFVPFFDWHQFNKPGNSQQIVQLDRWHLGLQFILGLRF